MAHLDVISFPGLLIFYAARYWWLGLAIAVVVGITVAVLRKKKKQMEEEEK